MCKMEGIRIAVKKLGDDTLRRLKRFLEDIVQKLPTDNFFITPNDINALLSSDKAKGVTVNRYETVVPKSKPPSDVDYSHEKMTI